MGPEDQIVNQPRAADLRRDERHTAGGYPLGGLQPEGVYNHSVVDAGTGFRF